MADALHEFYNASNLGFTALNAGQNIGGTTGSQKAVIRDIQITNEGNKNIAVKLGDIVLANVTKTETLSGTLILKESQNITISASDSIRWTGIGMSYESGTHFRELTWDADYYFLIPSSTKNTKSSEGWVTDSDFRSNGSALQNLSELDGMCNVFNAHSMFGKDLGDYYYMRDYQRANGNNHVDSNKLYFYDASADSSTQVNAGNSALDRRMWEGAWTNRYLIRFGKYSTDSYDRFDVFDTTTNSLSKDNAEMIRGYDSNTSSEDRMEDMPYQQRITSIMDKYCLIKGKMAHGTGRAFHLFDVTTGRFRTFYGGNTSDHVTSRFMSNNGTYQTYHNTAQICKGEDNVYYVINTYTRGSSGSDMASSSGFQVFSLGTDPATTYLAHGTGSFGDVYPTFRYKYHDTTNWNKFRLTHNSATSKQGYMNGFMPLKRITPTDSGCRYWMFMGKDACWLIDIQGTDSSAIQLIKFDQGSNSNYQYPWQGQSSLDDYVGNAWPIYNETAAASGWGTVAARTTGILTT